MRRTGKAIGTLAAAASLSLIGGGLAVADQWVADADTATTGQQSSVSLTATPGQTLTVPVPIWIDCHQTVHMNATSTLTFSAASSSKPATGTLSATSVTISRPTVWPADGAKCSSSDQKTAAQDSTVTIGAPTVAGTYGYTVKWSSNDTDVAANTATISFSVVVNTPPTVSVTGVTEGASYVIGSVPTVGCSVSDPEDSNESATPVISGTGLGAQTASCSYTDGGGLTRSQTINYTIVAPPNTPPSVSVVGVSEGASYMIGQVPSISCAVVDAEDTNESATPTVSGTSVGAQSATCSYTDGGGLTRSQTINYTITPPPNTAPSVSVTGVAHNSTHQAGSVPAAGCSVTDAEDGPSTPAAVISGTLNGEGVGTQKATCSYTDQGGLSASAFADYSVIDTAAPTLSGVSTGITEEATSIDGAVASWSAPTASGRSGETTSTSCTPSSGSTFALGSTQVSCTASDGSGNTSAAQTFNVLVRDTTAPTLSGVSSDITKEATSASGATVSWTAPTATGMVGETTSTSCSPSSGSTFALGTTQVSCTASDGSGNTSAPQTFNVLVRDTTAPTNISFSSTGVQDGGSYLRNFVPAAPTCSASDAVTATPTCVVTGYSRLAGTHTLTATATDGAGNSNTATMSYTVRTLTISAFKSPIDGNGVLNAIKGGNTVPIKFTVHDGSTERTDTAVVSSLSTGYVTCTASPEDTVEEFSSAGSTSLRYDSGQFIQNWKTPTGAGKCLKAIVTTVDGSSQTALFKLK